MRRFILVLSWMLLSALMASAEDKAIGTRLAAGKDPLLEPDLAQRRLVVVYYANDSYPPVDPDLLLQRWQSLLTALEEGAKSKDFSEAERARLATLGEQLKGQAKGFHEAIGRDVALLKGQLGKTIHRLAVFRNFRNGGDTMNLDPLRNLFRSFEWLSYAPGRDDADANRMPIPYEFFRPEYVWQPLAHPAVFRQAMEAVGKEFPPDKHRFLLIVRSHATRENILAPPVTVDATKLKGDEVCRVLLKAFPPRAEKEGDDLGDLVDRVNQALIDAFPVPTTDEPIDKFASALKEARTAELGTSKKSFLTSLYALGGGDFRKGTYFSLVVVASPRSALELSAAPDLKVKKSYAELNIPNVGRLYTWGDKVYRNDPLDLEKMLKDAGDPAPGTDFQDILQRWLEGDAPKK